MPLPPPKAPNPSRSQTFPRSSSPRPREPAIQGMENSGRRSAEPGGEREGGRAAGGRRTGVGLALPHSLIFFFYGVGVGCFLVALKETKKHSRNGTSSPQIPPRDSLPPRAGAPSAGVGKFAARPQPGSPAPAARPHPPPGRLNSGEGMLIRVGPARDGGEGSGRGGAGPGAGRAEARRQARGGRAAESRAVAKRVNPVSGGAARRASPAAGLLGQRAERQGSAANHELID